MRLLIAYDGSDCARTAISDLERAGLGPDCTACVLSVLDAWLPPAGRHADELLPGLEDMRRDLAAALERQRETARQGAVVVAAKFPGWTVSADAAAESPAWAIIRRAEGHDGGVAGSPADLVVVGSHGHGGLRRLVLGSVSQKVVTHVRCSTRIARAAPAGAAGRPPRLIVGADGSECSNAAVRAVATRPWPAETEVSVITVDEAPLIFDPMVGAVPVAPETAWARPVAEAAAAVLARAGLKARAGTAVGYARHVLIDRAVEEGADCIFVGARGMRAAERFLLGSVATTIAMNAPCSVEIVHAPHGRKER